MKLTQSFVSHRLRAAIVSCAFSFLVKATDVVGSLTKRVTINQSVEKVSDPFAGADS